LRYTGGNFAVSLCAKITGSFERSEQSESAEENCGVVGADSGHEYGGDGPDSRNTRGGCGHRHALDLVDRPVWIASGPGICLLLLQEDDESPRGFIVLLAIFAFLAYKGVQNPFVPVAFLTGGFFSGLCGFLGMKTATNASARTAQGASKSLNSGLQVAFRSGAVMGLVVVGFGLFDISMWYLILDKVVYTAAHMKEGLTLFGLPLVKAGMEADHKLVEITTTMITFGMGASTQALFARVGGGIYTKAADVGADLVGKVEAGIPEDDPRNPATIADNVGDNVGDVAGMGADLYESYCGSILATAALGAALVLPQQGDVLKAVLAPMVVAGLGILLSIAGIFLVRCKEDASQKNLLRALLIGTLGSSVLIIAAVAILAGFGWITWGVFGSVVSGLVAGVLIGQFTEYYTSDEGHRRAGQDGPGHDDH